MTGMREIVKRRVAKIKELLQEGGKEKLPTNQQMAKDYPALFPTPYSVQYAKQHSNKSPDAMGVPKKDDPRQRRRGFNKRSGRKRHESFPNN